jgi:hypothetical protein
MIRSLVPATLRAAPLLWAGLAKIAHTPTARLPVGYHVVPRWPCRSLVRLPALCIGEQLLAAERLAQIDENEFLDLLALNGADVPPLVGGNLGALWQLQRYIAGGIVGEVLPLANLRCEEQLCLQTGELVDVCC